MIFLIDFVVNFPGFWLILNYPDPQGRNERILTDPDPKQYFS